MDGEESQEVRGIVSQTKLSIASNHSQVCTYLELFELETFLPVGERLFHPFDRHEPLSDVLWASGGVLHGREHGPTRQGALPVCQAYSAERAISDFFDDGKVPWALTHERCSGSWHQGGARRSCCSGHFARRDGGRIGWNRLDVRGLRGARIVDIPGETVGVALASVMHQIW